MYAFVVQLIVPTPIRSGLGISLKAKQFFCCILGGLYLGLELQSAVSSCRGMYACEAMLGQGVKHSIQVLGSHQAHMHGTDVRFYSSEGCSCLAGGGRPA